MPYWQGAAHTKTGEPVLQTEVDWTNDFVYFRCGTTGKYGRGAQYEGRMEPAAKTP